MNKKGIFHYHQGIDIGNAVGQTIVSVVDGIVVTACDSVPLDNPDSYRFSGYGKVVIVKGKSDGLYYFHAHCAELLVKEGDEVFEQMPIAKVGETAYTRDEPQRMLEDSQPHLHFEVSSTSYAGGKAKERTTEDHSDHPDLRMDPLQALEKLGPWGAGRKFFLPTGEQALRSNLDALSDAVDRQSAGGYFPIGANNFWHGGIHLVMPLGATVHAPMGGRVVAARLDEQEEWVYRDFGSTNFVLIRHEQRDALLATIWPEYQSYASARSISREVFQAYDFYIQELLTDLAYVGAPFAAGDGGGGSRHKVNALLAAKNTDIERMEALRDYVTNLSTNQQKVSGKKLRLQYIDAALEDMELA